MKSLKSLIAVSMVVAGLASSASANTTQNVYIAGAPAYRQDSNKNIAAYVATFSGNGAGLTATSASSTGATAVASANQNQWLIPNFSTGVDLAIHATFTGSSAGIESVAAGSIAQKFIDHTQATAAHIATPLVSQTNTDSEQPDFTLSDTFQQTTPFNGTVTLKGPTNTTSFTKTYKTLNQTELGIEPYVFVASPGATAAGLTNITTSQAQLLYTLGALPLAYFTGNSADEGKLVYGLTRDGGSGARLILQAETGIGVKSALLTYKPTVSGGTADTQSGNHVGGTITDAFNNVPVYPKGLIPSTGVWDNTDGDTGYAKFGTTAQDGLLLAITATPPSGALFVAYFNVPDGSEAIANGAVQLSYNGILYDTANVAASNAILAEGKYTFWSYESLFKASSLTGNPLTVANALIASWVSTTPTSSVNVFRTADGGNVLQNY